MKHANTSDSVYEDCAGQHGSIYLADALESLSTEHDLVIAVCEHQPETVFSIINFYKMLT